MLRICRGWHMQMNLINCYYGWNLVFLVSAIHACSWYFTQRNLKRRYLYVTLTFKAIIISFRFSCHDLISIRDHHVLKNFSLVEHYFYSFNKVLLTFLYSEAIQLMTTRHSIFRSKARKIYSEALSELLYHYSDTTNITLFSHLQT